MTPRYDQITLERAQLKNQLFQILSPNPDDDGVWIHQIAWFHLGHLEKGFETEYRIKDLKNGVYVFILDGSITLDDQQLGKRDGYGVWDIKSIRLKANSQAKVLLMEVPMVLA